MSPRSKFTDSQISHVLKLYSTVSTAAAYNAGEDYGMTPGRIRRFASNRRIPAKMDENSRWRPTRDVHNDARWARARAIGAVIA
jgi:hypothetical protein